MCGILCNRDNCKRGLLSQVGPGPPGVRTESNRDKK